MTITDTRVTGHESRSYAARCADEYETAATTALRAVTEAGKPPMEGTDATAAVVNALLTIGERLSDGQTQIAEALSDVGAILESGQSDRVQQSIDLAEQIEQLTGSVDYLASYVRASLPLTTRLRLSWRARRWAAKHQPLAGETSQV